MTKYIKLTDEDIAMFDAALMRSSTPLYDIDEVNPQLDLFNDYLIRTYGRHNNSEEK